MDAIVWSADSNDRDFRDEEWSGKSLNVENLDLVEAEIEYPGEGYKAFYLDLQYTDPHGDQYTESTRMFVMDEDEIL